MSSDEEENRKELFTSSDIVLKDQRREKWLTIVSHDFSLGNEKIYHSNVNFSVIGDVEKTFGNTDIFLTRLHNDVYYSSQTFSSDLSPAVDIKYLEKLTDLKIGDILTMKNAFSITVKMSLLMLCEVVFEERREMRASLDDNLKLLLR